MSESCEMTVPYSELPIIIVPAHLGSQRVKDKLLRPTFYTRPQNAPGTLLIERAIDDVVSIARRVRTQFCVLHDGSEPLVETIRNRLRYNDIEYPSNHMESVTGIIENGTDRLVRSYTFMESRPERRFLIYQADQVNVPIEWIRALCTAQQDGCTIAYHTTDRELIDNTDNVKVMIDRHNKSLWFSRLPHDRYFPTSQSTAYIHVGLYCGTRRWFSGYELLPSAYATGQSLEQLRFLEAGRPWHVITSQYKPVNFYVYNSESDFPKKYFVSVK